MVSSDQSATLIMIFSLLIAALVWNFGTWYFGLPVSSSHSFIGSLVGVSIAFGYDEWIFFFSKCKLASCL